MMTADGAQQQRERHVTARVANLLGHVGRGVPPRVGEHHWYQGEQPTRGGDRTRHLLKVRARSRANREPQRNEHQQCAHLQGRQDVHNHPARPDTTDMHERNQPDDNDGEQRVTGKRQRNKRDRQDEPGRGISDARYEPIERGHEEDRARRHRARESGNERGPSGHESGKRTVGLTQVDILPASSRPQRRKLCIRHRARKRQNTTGNPG